MMYEFNNEQSVVDFICCLGFTIKYLPEQISENGLSDRQLDHQYKTCFYERTERIIRKYIS